MTEQKKSTKRTSALLKPVTPSAALARIVGAQPLPRTEITKKIWDYIKANKLQDPKNKRVINADATLKAVVEKDSVDMFELPGALKKHMS